MINPENGKPIDKVIGLGKWRCTQCNKKCTVTVHSIAVKQVVQP